MRNDFIPSRCLSGSALKMIAIVSMTIDHLAYYVMAESMGLQDCWLYDFLRGVGRLAFPIFAFLIVEGYRHTHNLFRYMLTLLVTAIISDIPWFLLGETDSHNVIYTLLFGLIAISLVDYQRDKTWLMLAPVGLMAMAATLLNTDYSWHGIGLMMVFYIFRDKPLLTIAFGLPFLMEYGIIGPLAGLSITIAYSGSRGFIHGRYMKYLFYLYYPLHLMAIWMFL